VTWLFADRETGRLVIGQFPNLPLWIFLAAVALRLLFRPSGDFDTALTVVANVALLWWAFWEVLRGVNPWRRLLGSMVAVVVIGAALVSWL